MTYAKDLSESFFSIPLSTFRDRDVPLQPFPYGLIISAVSIFFFRTTVQIATTIKEPSIVRYSFGAVLAFLSYSNKPYEFICAVEIFSYLATFLLFSDRIPLFLSKYAQTKNKTNAVKFALIGASAVFCPMFCHLAARGSIFQFFRSVTPAFITDSLMAVFPILEIQASYDIMDEFILEEGLLLEQVARLFFITFHIQVGIGYLGIDFLKQEQHRRNELVRMDMDTSSENESEVTQQKDRDGRKIKRFTRFQRTAAPFIFFTAVPYMIKVIGYGNLNAFAFVCMKDDVHRSVRLYDLFDHDNHLVALADHSAKAPAGKKTKCVSRNNIIGY